MRTQTNSIKRGVLIAASALLTATFVGLLLTESTAQAAQKAVNDRAGFLSQAQEMHAAGSPISPGQCIVVCYKGTTMQVSYATYKKYPTLYIPGPCSTWTLVCYNKQVSWIKTSTLSYWLRCHRGAVVGNCTSTYPTATRVICWKGWEIVAYVKDLVKYPGYVNGVCH